MIIFFIFVTQIWMNIMGVVHRKIYAFIFMSALIVACCAMSVAADEKILRIAKQTKSVTRHSLGLYTGL
jgi:hypothetical protein